MQHRWSKYKEKPGNDYHKNAIEVTYGVAERGIRLKGTCMQKDLGMLVIS